LRGRTVHDGPDNHAYVDFVREGVTGKGAARSGPAGTVR